MCDFYGRQLCKMRNFGIMYGSAGSFSSFFKVDKKVGRVYKTRKYISGKLNRNNVYRDYEKVKVYSIDYKISVRKRRLARKTANKSCSA